MLQQPEPACLVIADISGYSSYLAGVELDHAQDILADLIDTIVETLRPHLTLAKLEGDAAFTFLPGAAVDGPALRDIVDGSYFAFQRRIRDMTQASACECAACDRIPGLDLKFVMHHGLIGRQRMAGTEELVGTDVVLVHRLLKNQVATELELTAYALYTDALIGAMGLEDPAAAGMHRHRASFESVGEVDSWVTDLRAAWAAEQQRRRLRVTDDDAFALITMPAAVVEPEILWEWSTSPARRLRWTTDLTRVDEETVAGRRGVGTVNHCVHGETPFDEVVLDWAPPIYLTKRIARPGMPPFVATMELLDLGQGRTQIVWRMAEPESSDDRRFFEAAMDGLRATVQHDSGKLIEMAVADARQRATSRAAEPQVSPGTGRFLSEPVDVAGSPIVMVTDDSPD